MMKEKNIKKFKCNVGLKIKGKLDIGGMFAWTTMNGIYQRGYGGRVSGKCTETFGVERDLGFFFV